MKKPDHYDPLLEILRERGDRHEKGFIQYLKDQGYSVVEIDGIDISEQAIAQCFGHWPMKWV